MDDDDGPAMQGMEGTADAQGGMEEVEDDI